MSTTDPLPSRATALALAGSGTVLFILVTWLAHLPEVHTWDLETIAAFAGMGGDLAVTVSREVTALGNALVALAVGAVAALLLLAQGRRTGPLLIAVAVPLSVAVNHGLKWIVGRPRPDAVEWFTHAGAHAFPSGHALYAVAAYGAVTLAILPVLREGRVALLAGWMAVALALGMTRIHLGVHHPTDVLAGYAAGLAWLGFSVLLTRLIYHPELRVHRERRFLG